MPASGRSRRSCGCPRAIRPLRREPAAARGPDLDDGVRRATIRLCSGGGRDITGTGGDPRKLGVQRQQLRRSLRLGWQTRLPPRRARRRVVTSSLGRCLAQLDGERDRGADRPRTPFDQPRDERIMILVDALAHLASEQEVRGPVFEAPVCRRSERFKGADARGPALFQSGQGRPDVVGRIDAATQGRHGDVLVGDHGISDGQW